MKYYCLLLLILFSACNDEQRPAAEQKPKPQIRDTSLVPHQRANPFATVDISPMDMAYLPTDYPVLKMTHKLAGSPVARVVYSRPHRQGRTIFGGLLKYGEPWRLGANEATEIEFFQPVTIQNKTVGKGRYILYCVPQEHRWTIVFNSNLFTWGLTPDPSKDLFRFEIPVASTPSTLEYFTMAFEDKKDSADLIMAWENFMGRLPIQY
jgi:hypothetical protein